MELTCDRAGTPDQPATDANYFTAALETNIPNNPAGYLTMRIRDSGAVILRGLLPDGSRQIASSHVSVEDTVLVSCSSYRGRFGSLTGLATFSADRAPLFGFLTWQRPVATLPFGAFSDESVELVGAPFSPSIPGRILGDFDTVNGEAVFRTVPGGGTSFARCTGTQTIDWLPIRPTPRGCNLARADAMGDGAALCVILDPAFRESRVSSCNFLGRRMTSQ